jgi:hypothetical protein
MHAKKHSLKTAWPFLKLRGIAKDSFKSLGGGEEFLRKEREQFRALPPQNGDKA